MAISVEQFVESLSITGLMTADELKAVREGIIARKPPPDVETLAKELVKAGRITKFQANAIYQGKGKGLVCGEYVLLEKIGAGGMGQVFKARHKRMNRIVAVKLLAPHTMVGDKQKAVKRFYQEVETAARLVHPNIVIAHDAGEANGLHFLVMEYVEGQDLSSALKPDKKLPLDQALGIVLQAARGLEYAHSQGVVHRDIKPSNLLMDKKGTVKILDMGLARVEDALTGADRAAGAGLTQSGEIMGTVDYMAPEQARNTRDADARADIYSLGCTLFRLATGRVVFEGETMVDKILGHYDKPVPPLGKHCEGVSHRLGHAFERMLAKNAEERFQSMTEVIAELEACRADVPEEEHAPLVTDEPPAQHGLESFLNKASGTGLSQKPMPLPPAPQRSSNAGGILRKPPEPVSEKPDDIGNRRVWMFAGGGLAALLLIGALVALLMRDKSPQAPADTPPVATLDPTTGDPAKGEPATATGETKERAPSTTSTTTVPAPTTEPPAKAPEPAVTTSTPSVTSSAIPPEGIDLLKLVDLKRDVGEGAWSQEGSTLVAPRDVTQCRLQFPFAPPAEYDLHVEAETNGASRVGIGLVVGPSRAVVNMDQQNRKTGLGHIDGKASYDQTNPTHLEGAAGFGPGMPMTLVCQVRLTSIRVDLNGQPVVDWKGDPQQLSVSGSIAGPDKTKLFLYALYGARFSRYELLPPGGQSRRIPPGGIDLLKLVDLKRDVGEGTWTFEGPALVPAIRGETGREVPSRLQFPYAPPPEYDLHIELETFSLSQLGIGLVVGSSRAMFGMNQQMRKTYLWQTAAETDQNPTLMSGAAGFGPKQPMAIVCQVRPTSVVVTLNGQTVVDWKGDPQEFAVPGQWASADKTKLFLYSFRGVRVTRYEVLPPGGTLQPKSTPAEVAAAPTKPGVRVNLLRLIDVERDSLDDVWRFDGPALVSPGARSKQFRLQVPYVPPSEYELRVVAEPLERNGHLTIGLVAGSSRVGFLTSLGDRASGLDMVGGKTFNNNETTFPEPWGAQSAAPWVITCRVKPTHIVVMFNGRTVVDWQGTPNQLSMSSSRASADRTKLCLQTGSDKGFRITRFDLLPGGGQQRLIPASEALAAAQAKARELIGELPKNASPAQRADAARRLHEQAAAVDDDTLLYAQLTEAVQLATAADDLHLMVYLLEDLARCFPVDATSLISKSLSEVVSRTRTPNERKDLVFKFLETATDQINAERYDHASLLVKSAATVAAKTADTELKKEVHNRELEAEAGQKLFAAAEPARKTLSDKPDDATAHLALGTYLAVARDDWLAALAHLSKGNDALVRTAAQAESQGQQDPSRFATIGALWLDAAEKAELPAKAVYLDRARKWLAQGAGKLKPSDLAKLLARYKKVDTEVRKVAGSAFVKRHPLGAASYGGHWYQFLPESATWHEARRRCEELGGYLVCLETAPEAQWMYQFAAAQAGKPDSFSFWIGATEEGHDGTFTWVNGNPLQFADWHSANPGPEGGEAVEVLRDTRTNILFKWRDRPPTEAKPFICEWER